jgi:lipid-A-disaccharide synthase
VLLLGREYEYLLPVAPTLNPEFLSREVREDEWGDARIELPYIKLVPDTLPALSHSRAGIVASGTATVEAAMIGTPFVMVYRVSPLTYALGKPRIKVPYFAMVNLIAGEKIVPELVQHDFTAANVVSHVRELLAEGDARTRMVAGFAKVRTRLKPTVTETRSAADRAAEEVLRLLTPGSLVPSASNGNPAARIRVQ